MKRVKNRQELTDTETAVKKKKKRRNTETIIITYFFVFLMIAMMGNLAYFVAAESESVLNNSYNTRQELLASKNIRGKILTRDGEVLAQTVVDSSGNETREYPYDNLFAHVVGYSTKGKTGVESLGNIQLLTSNSFIGDRIQNEIDSEKNYGDNVITTLDLDLQQVAYNALGVYSGAIIVSEPSTGKILAMVSKPDFDPNQIVSLWDDLISDDTSSVLVNRATQGLYPPGSTFKIITALEYYRQNQGYVDGYSYNCKGSFSYEGHKINCYHGSSHGTVNFQKSFEKSCNASFANIGISLNLSEMETDLNKLLFNTKLPTDLVSNQSSYVLTASDDAYDVMQTVIGQGKTQMTPLHLNMLTCAIANGGKLMRPYVIDRIENNNGSVMKQYSPSDEGNLLTVEEAVFLQELMAGVVENGTASKLKGLSYTAAGKTGSAEYNGEKSDSHAWFTGFAPADDPQVAITIIVEGAGSGGDYAVPVARRIFDEFFKK